MRKYLVLVLMVLASVAGFSSPALAHSDEFISVPATGSTVSDVMELQFTFAEALEPSFTPETALTQDTGTAIELGAPTFDATNTVMTIPLPQGALVDGVYSGVTRIVSVDGHAATYEFSFTVAGSPQQPVTDETPTETPVPISEMDEDVAVTTTAAAAGPGIEFALASIASLVVIGTAVLVIVSLRRRRNAQKD